MANKKKTLIIYHSGSGSTRTISEILYDRLSEHHEVDLVKISPDFDYEKLSQYDQVLFGYPTYYFKPSCSTTEFIEKMPVLKNKKQFLIFTTYGLYSGNSIWTLAGMLQKKNVIIKGYSQIRGPASDGALLLPSFFKLFFRYERKANIKINNMIRTINKSIKDSSHASQIPLPRWYFSLTRLFTKQLSGIDYSGYKKNLKVLESRCDNCNICVTNCIRDCWVKGKDKPGINTDKCEFCLKCIHNCPGSAIIFNEKMKDNPRLNIQFYKKLKKTAF